MARDIVAALGDIEPQRRIGEFRTEFFRPHEDRRAPFRTGDTDLFLCDVGAKLLKRAVKAPPASSIQKGKCKRQKDR